VSRATQGGGGPKGSPPLRFVRPALLQKSLEIKAKLMIIRSALFPPKRTGAMKERQIDFASGGRAFAGFFF
jgi:hypothetical protein